MSCSSSSDPLWFMKLDPASKSSLSKTCVEFYYNRVLSDDDMKNPILIRLLEQEYSRKVLHKTPQESAKQLSIWLKEAGSLSEPRAMESTILAIIDKSNKRVRKMKIQRHVGGQSDGKSILQRTSVSQNESNLRLYKDLVRQLKPDQFLIKSRIEQPMVQQLVMARRVAASPSLTKTQLNHLRQDIPRLQLVEQQFQMLDMFFKMSEEEMIGYDTTITEVNVKFVDNLKSLVERKKSDVLLPQNQSGEQNQYALGNASNQIENEQTGKKIIVTPVQNRTVVSK